jgi:glycosyltransferase involved in cell wall biosynthesis
LADTILKAFENPDLLKTMGLVGQEYCLKNFTWENTAKKIIERIQQYYTV